MKAATERAIKKKIVGIKWLTQGKVWLGYRVSDDGTLTTIYDQHTRKELHVGSADKILTRLAELECAILDLDRLGYEVIKEGRK